MTWERKILQKIYGPKCEQGVWKMRTNLEQQRLVWLGHIRIDGACMAKKRCSSQNLEVDVILEDRNEDGWMMLKMI